MSSNETLHELMLRIKGNWSIGLVDFILTNIAQRYIRMCISNVLHFQHGWGFCEEL